MTANTWAEVPVAVSLASLNPTLDASINPNFPSFPEYASSNTTSWSTLASAWNGGCYDRSRDEFLIPLTGGHADYAGNDFLALRLYMDSPVWERRCNPSGWDGSVITNDQARLRPGSSGSVVYFAQGTDAPLLHTGARDEASAVDDFYNGMTLSVFGQTNRAITDYDGATGAATVTPAFSGDQSGKLYSVSNGPMVHGLNGEKTGRYSDGRARAVHTYNIPEFSDLDDAPWMAVGGSGLSWTASQGNYDSLRVDRVNGAHSFNDGPSSSVAASPLGAGCTYDPTRGSKGSIWYCGQNGSYLLRLDCDTRTWSQSASFSPRGGQQMLVYLPGHDLILLANNSGGWAIYDPVANTMTNIGGNVSGTPAGGATDIGAAQLCYVAADNSVYWWNNPAGSTAVINKMTVPANPKTGAWTITQTTPAGSNTVTPSARQANGTFGRFRYSSRLDGFVLWNAVDGPVYFYARAAI